MTRVNNINKYSVIPDLLLPENVAYQQFLGTEIHSSMIHAIKTAKSVDYLKTVVFTYKAFNLLLK